VYVYEIQVISYSIITRSKKKKKKKRMREREREERNIPPYILLSLASGEIEL